MVGKQGKLQNDGLVLKAHLQILHNPQKANLHVVYSSVKNKIKSKNDKC